ncbi:MAG: glycosyltransferase family 39 protein [Pseudomonadota bacterium]|nr:glycosyltransferase family 39 protein [Pseudomonadota bacterium]
MQRHLVDQYLPALFARSISRAFDRPGRVVGWCLLAFAAVWLVDLNATSLSPPTDNIEQLTWVHAIAWGYYKHPPLPTWLIWLPVRLFGDTAAVSYVAGATCTLLSLALMWNLLHRLRGPRYAAVALMAALCITYYNGRLYFYNHETVLMLFVAASASLYWQAHSTGRTKWWLALGAAVGLGALAKYQMAVAATCIVVFWWWQGSWRVLQRRRGLLLAALVALLVFAPHIAWLRLHDFGPIHYASASSLGADHPWGQRWLDSTNWLASQLLNRGLPAWLLLAFASRGRRRSQRSAQPGASPHAGIEPGSRSFLIVWGIVPLLFVPVMGLLVGAHLQKHWGTPFLMLAVPAVMELSASVVDWQRVAPRSLVGVFLVLQLLLLAETQLTAPSGPAVLRDPGWRSFDSQALAQAVESPARRALGGRICLVSGPPEAAGALALRLQDRPLVLIDGQLDRSPWVDPLLPERCGVLRLRDGAPSAGWIPLGAAFPQLSWQIVEPGRTLDTNRPN